jgi:hypothetical protein
MSPSAYIDQYVKGYLKSLNSVKLDENYYNYVELSLYEQKLKDLMTKKKQSVPWKKKLILDIITYNGAKTSNGSKSIKGGKRKSRKYSKKKLKKLC